MKILIEIVFSLKKDNKTIGQEVTLMISVDWISGSTHSHILTIKEWNTLSTNCVTSSNVNMFKNKVDTYLRRADYR